MTYGAGTAHDVPVSGNTCHTGTYWEVTCLTDTCLCGVCVCVGKTTKLGSLKMARRADFHHWPTRMYHLVNKTACAASTRFSAASTVHSAPKGGRSLIHSPPLGGVDLMQ